MTRTNIKKLYLGVYTKDGEHIPIRLISLIATPDNKWRSVEGIAHYGYFMEAKIIGPSEKYPGCTVLQRKYALIDEEFAKSYIFAYCKASLIENDS